MELGRKKEQDIVSDRGEQVNLSRGREEGGALSGVETDRQEGKH